MLVITFFQTDQGSRYTENSRCRIARSGDTASAWTARPTSRKPYRHPGCTPRNTRSPGIRQAGSVYIVANAVRWRVNERHRTQKSSSIDMMHHFFPGEPSVKCAATEAAVAQRSAQEKGHLQLSPPGLVLIGIINECLDSALSSFRSIFANILQVTTGQRTTRRRLHNTVRKTILSYYSEEEAAKVVKAAKKQNVTISNFVASAALKAAEVVFAKPAKHSPTATYQFPGRNVRFFVLTM